MKRGRKLKQTRDAMTSAKKRAGFWMLHIKITSGDRTMVGAIPFMKSKKRLSDYKMSDGWWTFATVTPAVQPTDAR